MVRDILRLELAVFSVSKYLNRVRRSLVCKTREIPISGKRVKS